MSKENPSTRNRAAINCTEWQLAAAQDLTDLFMPRNTPSIERLMLIKIIMEAIVKNHELLLKALEQWDAE